MPQNQNHGLYSWPPMPMHLRAESEEPTEERTYKNMRIEKVTAGCPVGMAHNGTISASSWSVSGTSQAKGIEIPKRERSQFALKRFRLKKAKDLKRAPPQSV
ncbi:hypothetical protein DdX_15799 [Ditylenchus destructor]|uniref:Uncharacterized protein n=1 Tax=Ditylenchus destructor TaxID=166010 RepID=A0AAD4MPN8_9BILA|nr:hypothetical protein DdX_15799 [Ditylenchus destructor]